MKKKILTIFLAFAIMMTFMPSMAFADDIPINSITVSINLFEDGSMSFDPGHDHVFFNGTGIYLYDNEGNQIAIYQAEGSDEGSWYDKSFAEITNKEEIEEMLNTASPKATKVLLGTSIKCAQGEGFVFSDINSIQIAINVNGKTFTPEVVTSEQAVSLVGSTENYCVVFEDFGNLALQVQFDWPMQDDEDKDDILEAFVKRAVHAVATVVGTAVRNAQKIAFAKQMAYKTKMWQMAVQQQIYSIKAFRHTQAALTFAQFKLAINNLLRFSQFGFNPFGV